MAVHGCWLGQATIVACSGGVDRWRQCWRIVMAKDSVWKQVMVEERADDEDEVKSEIRSRGTRPPLGVVGGWRACPSKWAGNSPA